ncbi:uncharacterized protein SCHCODRAFT_02690501 [Schizophyllum commune H4-8]|nr:uncharacterized protein SCHCODRAFT_02690501 [Schizophyllum commune H4-8]KAI5890561.1 hypothetical protein SCHCODRAFT_02690501 [Schizophyllum commune H4-8]
MSFSSTTTSSAYVLCKYSKSYPTSAESSAEWQHFVNPVIRLVLDVRKRSDGGELESVRLRILWSMNSDDATGANDVVFEDLELLSFASFLARPSQRSNLSQGLPLKAVYRDNVVGIRYLYQRDNDPTSKFRRFQVTFSSTPAAMQFIDSISSVCPCKANPPPVGQSLTRQATIMSTPARPSPYSRSASVTPTRVPHGNRSIHSVDKSTLQTAPSFAIETESYTSPSFVVPTPPSGLKTLPETGSALGPPPSSLPPSSPYGNAAYLSNLSSRATSQPPSAQDDTLPSHSGYGSRTLPTPSQSSAPSSTPVSTSDCEMMPPPPPLAAPSSDSASQNQDRRDQPAPLLAAVREASGLYDMPKEELENMLANIIREEQFLSLVRCLVMAGGDDI